MSSEIDTLADFLGRDDPEVLCLLRAAQNRQLHGFVLRSLRRFCSDRYGVDPDNLPSFPLVRALPHGDILIGRILNGETEGAPVAIPGEQLCRHVGIFGQSGAGKTRLAKAIVRQVMDLGKQFRVWVLDTQNEYADLVTDTPSDRLVVVTPDRLRISLCQPAHPSISPQSELQRFSLLLRETQYIRDGSCNLLVDKLLRRLDDNGVFSGASRYLTLTEMLALFKGSRFGMKSRNAGYLEAIINRLTMLHNALPGTFEAAYSEMLSFLAQRSTIFRLPGLVGPPLQSLAAYLLNWLLAYRSAECDGSIHLVVIEEPHLLSADPRRQDIGEPVLPTAFRLARHSATGLLLSDQVPSLLPPAILANLATRVVFRTSGSRDIWSLSNSMSLTRDQAEALTELAPRTAVVQYPGNPTAFLARIPEIRFGHRPTEQELRHRCRDALAGLTWSAETSAPSVSKGPRAPESAPESEELSGDAVKLMISICGHSEFTIKQHCRQLKMDRNREFRARNELLDMCLIEEAAHGMSGEVFHVPTEKKGADWARRHRVSLKRYKSGPAHESILRRLEAALGKALPGCRFRHANTLLQQYDKEPDLTAILNEQLLVIEVCCSNLEYDTVNLLDEAEIAIVHRVIAVTPTVELRKELAKMVDEAGERRDEPAVKDKIAVLAACTCTKAGFNWDAVLNPPEATES